MSVIDSAQVHPLKVAHDCDQRRLADKVNSAIRAVEGVAQEYDEMAAKWRAMGQELRNQHYGEHRDRSGG